MKIGVVNIAYLYQSKKSLVCRLVRQISDDINLALIQFFLAFLLEDHPAEKALQVFVSSSEHDRSIRS